MSLWQNYFLCLTEQYASVEAGPSLCKDSTNQGTLILTQSPAQMSPQECAWLPLCSSLLKPKWFINHFWRDSLLLRYSFMFFSLWVDRRPLSTRIQVLGSPSLPALPHSWTYISTEFEGPKCMILLTLLQFTPILNAMVEINSLKCGP